MNRLLVLVICGLALVTTVVACGGGGDAAADADKLTIVGSGG